MWKDVVAGLAILVMVYLVIGIGKGVYERDIDNPTNVEAQ